MKQIIIFFLVAFTIQAQAQVDTVFNADSSYYLLQHFDTDPITVDIPSIVVDGTVIMQKAKVHTMIFNQSAKSLSVSCQIIPYSVKDNGYGEIITTVVPIRSVEILATNATLVNPATGEITRNPVGEVMGQYDFFFKLATYQPVLVNSLIAQYLVQNTDWTK